MKKNKDHAIDLILTKIMQYKRRYNETSLNAWKRLTKNKNFSELMKMYYSNFKNKDYYLDRILKNNTAQNQFYKNNLIKDRTGIKHLIKTPSNKYTHRKK